MKSKQEVIQEAYEELGLPFHENYLYDNGWMKIKPSQYSSLYDKVDLLKLTAHVHSIRPKSLAGIESNNGWTRIESDADLLNIIGKHEFVFLMGTDGEIGIGFTNILNDKECLKYWKNNATHYQPIIKPEAPIY